MSLAFATSARHLLMPFTYRSSIDFNLLFMHNKIMSNNESTLIDAHDSTLGVDSSMDDKGGN